jgi:ABC-type nitrate/sulfonate/bicarbonate transport system substrate-binding protein
MIHRTGISLSALLLLALSCVSSAQAQTGSGPLKIVTRGTVSSTAVEWPDMVARKKGFYEKQGLKVEEALISPTTITPSLIGGTIQFGFINASDMMVAIKAGADLVAIGEGADPSAYSLVTGKSIKTIADLKGKTLSLAEPGDVYAEATKEILRKGGLDPDKDLNIRYGGNSNQRMAALAAGAVDAVPLVPPQDRLTTDQGFNIVAFYPDYFPHLALSTTAVSRAWAKNNADTVKAFMRAQAGATAWLYDPANKEEAIKILIDETKADHPSVEQAYGLYVVKMQMYLLDGCVRASGFEGLVEVMSKVNKSFKPGEPVSQFIDTQYCQK